MAEPHFLPTFFCLSETQKQHIFFCHSEAKGGKGKGPKRTTKIGRAFFGGKMYLFPSFEQNFA